MPASRPYPSLPDDELIRLCKAHDEDAFASLLERYKSRVFSLAYRMVGHQQEAEDVAQEAFIHAYRAMDTFRLGDKFSSWIYRITANLAIDHLRKRRHREVSIDAPVSPDTDMYIQLPDITQDPERRAVEAEFKAVVEKAISELSPAYKAVVVLRHVNNLAYEEIAEVLRIPLGTVKTRLFRAREILKRKVEMWSVTGKLSASKGACD
jgi:RNA polymerase sigma-70 factor (ECF subfamily)